jgi:hypothetical protein
MKCFLFTDLKLLLLCNPNFTNIHHNERMEAYVGWHGLRVFPHFQTAFTDGSFSSSNANIAVSNRVERERTVGQDASPAMTLLLHRTSMKGV